MRKRSKYRPREASNFSVFRAIVGVQRVASTGDDAVRLMAVNHSAFDEIAKGRGTQEHFGVLINVLNMAEVLAAWGHGKDWMPEIKAGQQALVELGTRSAQMGRYTFKAAEMSAIKLVLQVHDAQLEQVTVNEFDRAIQYVHQQIVSKNVTVIPSPKAAA